MNASTPRWPRHPFGEFLTLATHGGASSPVTCRLFCLRQKFRIWGILENFGVVIVANGEFLGDLAEVILLLAEFIMLLAEFILLLAEVIMLMAEFILVFAVVISDLAAVILANSRHIAMLCDLLPAQGG